MIPSLREAFREYGARRIKSRASYLVPRRGTNIFEEIKEVIPTIDQGNPPDLPFVRDLLDRIWQVYGKYSGVQLSNASHAPGTPWDHVNKTYQGQIPKGTDIPTESIRDYFLRLVKEKVAG